MLDHGLSARLEVDWRSTIADGNLGEDGRPPKLKSECRTARRRKLKRGPVGREQPLAPAAHRLIKLCIVLPPENAHFDCALDLLGHLLSVFADHAERRLYDEVVCRTDPPQE